MNKPEKKDLQSRGRLLQARRWVVKLGTGILSNPQGRIDSRQISSIAAQVATLRKKGCGVVLVSSGAIAAGMTRLSLRKRPTAIHDLQACAAIGQNQLMANYDRAFSRRGITVAQILLTHEDFRCRTRRNNARATLLNLLRRGVVPVINENDAVSHEEIRFGDNDQLASHVHELIHADATVILSNVSGFFQGGITKGHMLHTIPKVTAQIARHAGGAGSVRSVGGMKSKLLAARRVLKTGCPLLIANGRVQNVLIRITAGEVIGTIFLP